MVLLEKGNAHHSCVLLLLLRLLRLPPLPLFRVMRTVINTNGDSLPTHFEEGCRRLQYINAVSLADKKCARSVRPEPGNDRSLPYTLRNPLHTHYLPHPHTHHTTPHHTTHKRISSGLVMFRHRLDESSATVHNRNEVIVSSLSPNAPRHHTSRCLPPTPHVLLCAL